MTKKPVAYRVEIPEFITVNPEQAIIDEEEWRDIPGFDGNYQASSEGQVRSTDGLTAAGKRRSGRVLKQSPGSHGYLMVSIYGRKYLVHTLVLEAFDRRRPPGLEACHGQLGTQANHRLNLSWGTRAKNNGPDKARDHKSNRGERRAGHKLSWQDVQSIRKLLDEGKKSQREIAEMFGVKQPNISAIKRGVNWAHEPSNW